MAVLNQALPHAQNNNFTQEVIRELTSAISLGNLQDLPQEMSKKVGEQITRKLYQKELHSFLHKGMATVLGMGSVLWHQVLDGKVRVPRNREKLQMLRIRLDDLLALEEQNIERGIYPAQPFPILAHLRNALPALSQLPDMIKRRSADNHRDIPEHYKKDDSYPSYYRRNFHWQAGGWFSDESAKTYDSGVEFLFGGTADIMRRQLLEPLWRDFKDKQFSLLDVATGTGSILSAIQNTFKKADISAFDLSPSYHQYAARHNPKAKIIQAKAEEMPYSDQSFDALTCIFLFHELPPTIRAKVIAQMWRVLKPGGRLVIIDSAQVAESPDMEPFLNTFPKLYHEPFYHHYINNPIEQLLDAQGFEQLETTPIYFSKMVSAKKSLR